MANGKNHSIRITSIACHGTSDFGGANDEVYVIYQADAGVPVRYPPASYQRMNTTADPGKDVVQTWDMNLQLDFDYEVLVTLWDQDTSWNPNNSEFLINADYTSSTPPSSYSMSNNNGASYTITAAPIN